MGTGKSTVGRALADRLGFVFTDTDAMIEDTVRQLADTWERDEALQGINAFLTKTKAPWMQ